MFCPNCGKEIYAHSKFCQFCGAGINMPENNTKQKGNNFKNNIKKNKKPHCILVVTIVLFSILLVFCLLYIKTPEFAIYNAVAAMKDNDYAKTIKYVNIEKIANNRIDAYMTNAINDESMRNNPFVGLAYIFAETLKPNIISIIQESFKDIVESPENIFQKASKPKVLLFTCIKKFGKLSLQKTVNEPKKAEFKFNDGNKIKNLYIVLNRTFEKKWEVVDIYGYDFWQDNNVQYLQYDKNSISSTSISQNNNNTKDILLNNATIHHSKFQEKQKEYIFKFWRMNKEGRDVAFKKLYDDYLDKINKFEIFYLNNGGYDITREYAENYKSKYKKLGINFIEIEGSYSIIPDYDCLIKTVGIPKNWKKWLELQEKYVLQRLYNCNESGCEGETLSIDEIEQAIIDLENIEKISKEIASIKAEDYNYIPNTSARFIYTYLLGSELYWLFDYGATYKLYGKVQNSYKHFIENYKDSKYYPLIKKYYEKLKANKFNYSDNAHNWLIEEIKKL